MKKMLFLLLLIFGYCGLKAQSQTQKYVEKINRSFRQQAAVKKLQLFTINETGFRQYDLAGLEENGIVLSVVESAREKILREAPEFIEIQIPDAQRQLRSLRLIKADMFAEGFSLYDSADPDAPIDYGTQGVHYRGAIAGTETGFVAISVFQDDIMGLLVEDGQHRSLSRIQESTKQDYILFDEADLPDPEEWLCGTRDDDAEPYTHDELFEDHSRGGGGSEPKCVTVYVEIDYDIVEDKYGVVPATNYVVGIFNQSFIIYNIENINMKISEIFTWSTPSPYTNPYGFPATYFTLDEFQTQLNGVFNGDLGHLVSYGSSGVAAGFGGLCASNRDFSLCVSGVYDSYENVLPYSWSVNVVAHEMGHLMGSRHTHACVWNGNGTAIDGCSAVEGSCAQPPAPPFGGTVMSYCHLNSVGINFTYAFGAQPGSLLRSNIDAAPCLGTCTPIEYCESFGNVNSNVYIDRVILHTLDSKTGDNDGYYYDPNLGTKLDYGFVYTFTGNPGPSTGAATERHWRIWIDWNLDGDFDDVDELVGSAIGLGPVTIPVTVSDFAINGITTRMRVSMKVNEPADACETNFNGEVEDYIVRPIGVCPPPANVTSNNIGQTVASVSWDEVGTAYDYVFRYREAGTTTWTYDPNSFNPTFMFNLTPGTTYEYQVASLCVFGTMSSYSPLGTFTTLTNYCQPFGQTTQYEYIDFVNFSNINNPSGDNGGYTVWMSPMGILTRGATNTITIGIAMPDGNEVRSGRVWIDLNGDNDLTFDEEVGSFGLFGSAGGYATVTVNAMIPYFDVTDDPTLLRISLTGDGLPPLPCEVLARGEVEDYAVIIPVPLGGGNGNNFNQPGGPAVVDFHLAPNPADEVVQLELAEWQDGANYQLEITNMLGQRVYRHPIRDIRQTIPLGEIDTGVYLVKVEMDGEVVGVRKLVVR